MKKILLKIVFIMFLLASGVQAKTIKVLSLQDFSTQKPAEYYNFQILEKEELDSGFVLEAGTIITGQVCKIQPPKRGKRDSYFEIRPAFISYHEVTQKVENTDLTVKILGYEPIDPQRLVVSTAKKAVGFVFKGATQGISFVEGVATAPDGERLKTGFTKVYKDSPLSFVEVGEDLEVKKGDMLLLKTK